MSAAIKENMCPLHYACSVWSSITDSLDLEDNLTVGGLHGDFGVTQRQQAFPSELSDKPSRLPPPTRPMVRLLFLAALFDNGDARPAPPHRGFSSSMISLRGSLPTG
jgi:hypothetical protein